MKLVWTAIVVVVALTMGAVVAVTVLPDRMSGYLPGWLQRPEQPGAQVDFAFEADEGADLNEASTQAVNIVNRRLGDLRVLIAVTGSPRRISVLLTRSANVDHAIEVATRRGRLQVRLVDQTVTPMQAMGGRVPDGSELLFDRNKEPYVVERRAWLTSRDLADAQPAFDQRTNEPVVSFKLNTAGTNKFRQVTQGNVGRPFAIVIDNMVISAPIIREPILGGSGQISGNFTVQDANDLAILLRAGELPGRLTVIEIKPPAQ